MQEEIDDLRVALDVARARLERIDTAVNAILGQGSEKVV
jgi:hypothetical protein